MLLWWLADDRRLGTAVRSAIGDASTAVHVSSISIWEIAIKRQIGKLEAPGDIIDQLENERFDELPFTPADAWLAGHLEQHHTDPFDRAILAQGLRNELRIVTADARFAAYGVRLLQT